MNHKRGRPKSKRAGCLFCKPHKHEAHAKRPRSKRAQAALAEQVPRPWECVGRAAQAAQRQAEQRR